MPKNYKLSTSIPIGHKISSPISVGNSVIVFFPDGRTQDAVVVTPKTFDSTSYTFDATSTTFDGTI